MVKFNLSFVFFKRLKRWKIRAFQVILYFSIQVNSKLDVEVQSVTMIIVKDLRVQIMHSKCSGYKVYLEV